MNMPSFQSVSASQTYDFRHVVSNCQQLLQRDQLHTIQVNVGRVCNQACHHCHVDASPKRTESMALKTVTRILELLAVSPEIRTVDITGGAPELNPHFSTLVREARKLGRHVMDRCNLTILLEAGQEDLGTFLKEHQVEIIASMPCYLEKNVDKQRGTGVFRKSLEGIRKLNELGYGQPDSGLSLNLVYNPGGPSLPPVQHTLEQQYKDILKENYGIVFNQLFTMTNLPINRFAQDLKRHQQWDDYMALLLSAFNPGTVSGLMCRSLLSISWEGNFYDCDFNQMLEIPVSGKVRSVWDLQSFDDYRQPEIATASHCFGCTAGAGSSCGGTLV
ncbi:MAG: arsenosugar biosynthesis radical SAM protein ArsS [SAR324 cluster bacterium]|nr:arsenosugar biosynthesis radical SAM protein ArsS [SAR324 cluster bacterium]